VPGRDGVTYLWMARQTAAGNFAELCAHPFHPLYPFAVGVLLKLLPGLDAVLAGQIVAAGCGALATVPLFLATRHLFGEAAATWAALMYALGAWFARHPAECMSEGPFYLCAATWCWCLLRERPLPIAGGLAAGLAFLVRPEGGSLALAGAWLLAGKSWSRALRHLAAAVLVASCLPLAFVACGHGFVLTPKAAFNWDVGVGRADHGPWFYFEQLAKLPGDAYEGLGYFVFPLIIAGVCWHRPRSLREPTAALLLPFALWFLVIPLLRSNLRFVSGMGIILLPFAGVAFTRLWQIARWRWLFLALLLGSEAKLWFDRPADRTLERDLGQWIGAQLDQGDTVSSEMVRLWFFAGRCPPPPVEIGPADIVGWARRPECRFVAVRHWHRDPALDELRVLGFASLPLPPELRALPDAKDVLLFERRHR
jgi:hypothetical protein